MKKFLGILVVALASASITGGSIWYIYEDKYVFNTPYEIKLWWENFTDQFEERIVLAEQQPKGNPYQQPYVFNDDNDWFTHKLPAWEVAL